MRHGGSLARVVLSGSSSPAKLGARLGAMLGAKLGARPDTSRAHEEAGRMILIFIL